MLYKNNAVNWQQCPCDCLSIIRMWNLLFGWGMYVGFYPHSLCTILYCTWTVWIKSQIDAKQSEQSPAIQAVMKQATLPEIRALKPQLEKSDRLSGAIAAGRERLICYNVKIFVPRRTNLQQYYLCNKKDKNARVKW